MILQYYGYCIGSHGEMILMLNLADHHHCDMIFFKYELFYDDVTFPLKSRDTVQV